MLIPAVQGAAREERLRHEQVVRSPWGQSSIHTALHLRAIVEVPLAQTGEGIKECELTQWLVKVSLALLPLL